MDNIANLLQNAPLIKEDLTLGILSCTINVEGTIKTFYFQHLRENLIVNNELAEILRRSFEQAKIQDGDNGISTHLDAFIPSEIMDTSLIGVRQVGVDYIDSSKSILMLEYLIMKTKLPQALLYHMIDSALDEYKSNENILRFEISSEILSLAKSNGFFPILQRYIDSRGLKQEIKEGVEMGYKLEDTAGLKLAELRKNARMLDTNARVISDIPSLPHMEKMSSISFRPTIR